MKKLRIGIDVDCVLNNLHDKWVKWIWDKFGVSFPLEQWTSWDLTEVLPEEVGVGAYEFLDMPGAFYNTDPLPGSIEVTQQWVADGHDLIVATTTHPRMWDEKSQWLAHYFPHIPRENQIAIARKGLLDIDILIDDGIHNFKGFGGRPIVFNRPWNMTWNKHMQLNALFADFNKAVRVNNWEDIRKIVADLAVERTSLVEG